MQITIDVLTDRKEIFQAIQDSEDNQSMIGITSSQLGSGMYMTVVREIIEQGDELVLILSNYDVTGHFLERNRISFDSISAVLPFRSVFKNPFLKDLDPVEQVSEEEEPGDYIF